MGAVHSQPVLKEPDPQDFQSPNDEHEHCSEDMCAKLHDDACREDEPEETFELLTEKVGES